MITLPFTEELEAVARRNVWFKSPQDALRLPLHFIAHVLNYGTFEDVSVIKRHLGDEAFAEAIRNAPPDIMDARSWAYWNLKINRYPAPPMPQRQFE